MICTLHVSLLRKYTVCLYIYIQNIMLCNYYVRERYTCIYIYAAQHLVRVYLVCVCPRSIAPYMHSTSTHTHNTPHPGPARTNSSSHHTTALTMKGMLRWTPNVGATEWTRWQLGAQHRECCSGCPAARLWLQNRYLAAPQDDAGNPDGSWEDMADADAANGDIATELKGMYDAGDISVSEYVEALTEAQIQVPADVAELAAPAAAAAAAAAAAPATPPPPPPPRRRCSPSSTASH